MRLCWNVVLEKEADAESSFFGFHLLVLQLLSVSPNYFPVCLQVGPDVRGFPRPTCMPCPMDQTLPGFIGCGPPQPPPPWSTCGPPLPLVPPPCGPRSNSETCGAQGDKGGTVPKKDPEKDKVGPDVRGFPRPTCMPCPMDQTLPGFIGCGPPQPPPPWSTCGPPLPLVPPPCGPRSNSETCGAQGDKGGTVPKKDPEKDKVNTVAVSSCNHFWNPVPVWAAPCPGLVSVGWVIQFVCGVVHLSNTSSSRRG
ncbi:basic proline-rich protein-like [Ursus americanus]|uniref:basic proline-rich protein-like n=1 Tax=Ursus americanus TaxID=9643 RepID=UPI001E67CF54|nr:basic proline-rich protein-like [Ursus americanus]